MLAFVFALLPTADLYAAVNCVPFNSDRSALDAIAAAQNEGMPVMASGYSGVSGFTPPGFYRGAPDPNNVCEGPIVPGDKVFIGFKGANIMGGSYSESDSRLLRESGGNADFSNSALLQGPMKEMVKRGDGSFHYYGPGGDEWKRALECVKLLRQYGCTISVGGFSDGYWQAKKLLEEMAHTPDPLTGEKGIKAELAYGWDPHSWIGAATDVFFGLPNAKVTPMNEYTAISWFPGAWGPSLLTMHGNKPAEDYSKKRFFSYWDAVPTGYQLQTSYANVRGGRPQQGRFRLLGNQQSDTVLASAGGQSRELRQAGSRYYGSRPGGGTAYTAGSRGGGTGGQSNPGSNSRGTRSASGSTTKPTTNQSGSATPDSKEEKQEDPRLEKYDEVKAELVYSDRNDYHPVRYNFLGNDYVIAKVQWKRGIGGGRGEAFEKAEWVVMMEQDGRYFLPRGGNASTLPPDIARLEAYVSKADDEPEATAFYNELKKAQGWGRKPANRPLNYDIIRQKSTYKD